MNSLSDKLNINNFNVNSKYVSKTTSFTARNHVWQGIRNHVAALVKIRILFHIYSQLDDDR